MSRNRNGLNTKLKKLTYSLLTNTNSLPIGIFPNESAFSLRYQSAGMLETVLRQGVLAEVDTGEESPNHLKLPSRRPAILFENCLYSQEKDRRARAFHVMDPRSVLEILLIFVEDKDSRVLFLPFLDNDGDNANRVVPFLGKWKGFFITKRNGVYGSTNAEADTVALLEMDENSQLVEDITSTSDGQEVKLVHWMGTVSDNLVTFDGGYQLTFLPRGMYIRCPCDIAKSQSFHLEFIWLENPALNSLIETRSSASCYQHSSSY